MPGPDEEFCLTEDRVKRKHVLSGDSVPILYHLLDTADEVAIKDK